MNIITEYPLWLSVFCILAGIAYAAVLYFRDKRLAEINKWLIRLMAFFRFVVITLLSFLLLSPLLKSVVREVEKPVIIIAQDNSESIVVGKDSNFYRNEYKQKMNALIEKLSDKYEVRSYSFADQIKEAYRMDSIQFNEKQTDISSLFEELETRYSNRNVGAVILATDGIYNKGSNPIYSTAKFKNTIYTIALGDTTVKKDVVLSKVEHNRLAYLGNQFPLEVVINAKQFKGKSSVLSISKAGVKVFSQNLSFNSDVYSITVPVLLDAKEIGLQKYSVVVSPIADEMTIANNSKDIFIDVLDARQKILILSEAPHPDIAAIKQSIEANQNYEVTSAIIDNFNQSLKKFNLVILYQIPSLRNNGASIISELKSSNIPYWCFSGANSILKKDLSGATPSPKTNEVEPILDQNFPLFTISEELKNATKDFPAAIAPFGALPAENNSNVLFYQRIGIVDTKTPLMTFSVSSETKSAQFFGEGIWKWRLQDFAAHGNHQVFDEFISKTIQYLSVKVDKSFFRIITKNVFFENDAIEMEAEVYNESYELINTPEVEIVFVNSENKKFPFSFTKTTNAYRLNAGMLPVGESKYEAKVKVGDKNYIQKGSFNIVALKVEMNNTVADHQLLFGLAKNHSGELIYPNEIDSLADKLNAREDIKSISYSEKKLNDLISLKWIFFLLLILISLEWFIRKRNGAY
jgi:hypothetical protein